MIPFRPFPNVSGGFVGRDRSALESLAVRFSDFVQLRQVHGNRIFLILKLEDIPGIRNAEGDALVTSVQDVVVAVRAADCVPILIAHPEGIVAAVHAGWKGTAAEIVKKTLVKMKEEFSLDLSRAFLSIGPAICGHCYEVGEEVANRFGRFKGAVEALPSGKSLLNLKLINRQLAEEAGVPSSNIEVRPECTLCHEKDFYSYRGETSRGEKGEGRNVAWVMLE